MGRHFEVRAAAMASTAAKKSAIYMRASKEIYLAAKQGEPNPNSNLALRSAIDKFKGQGVPKDVVERAIKKASGTDAVAYIPGRYEVMGPGNTMFVIDTLTDNVNRAVSDIKAAIKKADAVFAKVDYNFTENGIFVFEGFSTEAVEEHLVLNDIDVWEVGEEDGKIQVLVNPTAFGAARDSLYELGVAEFIISEIRMLANETIKVDGDNLEMFNRLIDLLDEVQDVQSVYHNVEQ
ncbi:MAG TPA: YebC/PmpR family DNA-binding transcriptional regulator [Bacilli bacterium]|jgi:YebC/PmpR family DNA-binding regulatory protein|nr:YebC/PmpR family DNA-binding transcriptional regulator [Bacilli bacterium]